VHSSAKWLRGSDGAGVLLLSQQHTNVHDGDLIESSICQRAAGGCSGAAESAQVHPTMWAQRDVNRDQRTQDPGSSLHTGTVYDPQHGMCLTLPLPLRLCDPFCNGTRGQRASKLHHESAAFEGRVNAIRAAEWYTVLRVE
jgi:hypothetical protein